MGRNMQFQGKGPYLYSLPKELFYMHTQHVVQLPEKKITMNAAVTKERKKAGRKPYLDALINNMMEGLNAVPNIKEDDIKRVLLHAIQKDARIGGKMGRTIAEVIEMCQAALNTAGYPTERIEILKLLAEEPNVRPDGGTHHSTKSSKRK